MRFDHSNSMLGGEYLAVLSCSGDIESRRLGQILIVTLEKAGFKPNAGQVDCLDELGLLEGIRISLCDPERCAPSNTDPATEELFASALSDALMREAMEKVSIEHIRLADKRPPGIKLGGEGVMIFVGVKPIKIAKP